MPLVKNLIARSPILTQTRNYIETVRPNNLICTNGHKLDPKHVGHVSTKHMYTDAEGNIFYTRMTTETHHLRVNQGCLCSVKDNDIGGHEHHSGNFPQNQLQKVNNPRSQEEMKPVYKDFGDDNTSI